MKSFRKPAPLGFTRTTAYFCRLNEGYEKPMKEISSKISKVFRKLRKLKKIYVLTVAFIRLRMAKMQAICIENFILNNLKFKFWINKNKLAYIQLVKIENVCTDIFWHLQSHWIRLRPNFISPNQIDMQRIWNEFDHASNWILFGPSKLTYYSFGHNDAWPDDISST